MTDIPAFERAARDSEATAHAYVIARDALLSAVTTDPVQQRANRQLAEKCDEEYGYWSRRAKRMRGHMS